MQPVVLLWMPLAGTAVAMGTPEGTGTPANPSVTAESVMVSRDGLFAYRLDDGTERWRVLIGLPTSAPTSTTARVLVGADRALWALEPGRGHPIWHVKMQSRVFGPVVAGDVVFVSDTGGLVRALRASDGHLIWQRTLSAWVYPPALADGVLVAGGQAHRLWGLDQANGRTLWERSLPQESVYRPVAAGELVVVTTYSGDVLALFPKDGGLVWSLQDPAPSQSPVLSQGRLLLLGLDGHLRARRAGDGRLLWDVAVPELSPSALLIGTAEPLLLDGRGRQWIIDPRTGSVRGPFRNWEDVPVPAGVAAALHTLYRPVSADHLAQQ